MPIPATRSDSTATAASREPDQLQLRLFAVIDRYRRVPPEKALWRELLDCALNGKRAFTLGGRQVSAADVHHVAWAVFARANPAGILEEFSLHVIAADTRRSQRTVRAAVAVLNVLRVFRSTRPSRRKPAVHRLNIGGLDWPAVRARIDASGDEWTPLSGDERTPLKGYTEGLPIDPDRDLGSEAAAALPIAREAAATAGREQQQRDQRAAERIENLIGAIASRCRRLGRPFDEATCRCSLAAGRIDVDDLQHLLNTLPDTRRRGARL